MKGKITNIDLGYNGSLSVESEDGNIRSFSLNAQSKVNINNAPVKNLTGVKIGDTVSITMDKSTVGIVDVTSGSLNEPLSIKKAEPLKEATPNEWKN